MENINYVSVESSNVAKVGYIPEKEELHVIFKSDSHYSYEKVPVEVYNNLIKAESVGKYFNENVKKNYQFSKVK